MHIGYAITWFEGYLAGQSIHGTKDNVPRSYQHKGNTLLITSHIWIDLPIHDHPNPEAIIIAQKYKRRPFLNTFFALPSNPNRINPIMMTGASLNLVQLNAQSALAVCSSVEAVAAAALEGR